MKGNSYFILLESEEMYEEQISELKKSSNKESFSEYDSFKDDKIGNIYFIKKKKLRKIIKIISKKKNLKL